MTSCYTHLKLEFSAVVQTPSSSQRHTFTFLINEILILWINNCAESFEQSFLEMVTYKCAYSLYSLKWNTPCRALAWNSGVLKGILLWALLN